MEHGVKTTLSLSDHGINRWPVRLQTGYRTRSECRQTGQPFSNQRTTLDRILPNLRMQAESGRQSRLKIDFFSCDGVVEFQKLGVQEISPVAGKAGKIFKRLAVYPYKGSPTRGWPMDARWILI